MWTRPNVLETSRLWRSVMHRLAEEYPDVQYEDVLVDNCAMQLVKDPGQFDVVVTENMFGDILSDEASMVTGSIGLLPSASIGDTAPGLYEPIPRLRPRHCGSGQGQPIATILSVAMMFSYSFHLAAEADAVEAAVDAVLAEGWRTPDIAGPGVTPIGTQKMGDSSAVILVENRQPKGCPVSCVCPLHMVYWLYLVTERGTNQ